MFWQNFEQNTPKNSKKRQKTSQNGPFLTIFGKIKIASSMLKLSILVKMDIFWVFLAKIFKFRDFCSKRYRGNITFFSTIFKKERKNNHNHFEAREWKKKKWNLLTKHRFFHQITSFVARKRRFQFFLEKNTQRF